MNESDKRPVGRPPSSVESPTLLARKDFMASLKLQARIRGIIEENVDKLSEKLSEPAITNRQMTEILEKLASLHETLTRSIQQVGKFVMTSEEKVAEKAGGEMSKEQLMKELVG